MSWVRLATGADKMARITIPHRLGFLFPTFSSSLSASIRRGSIPRGNSSSSFRVVHFLGIPTRALNRLHRAAEVYF